MRPELVARTLAICFGNKNIRESSEQGETILALLAQRQQSGIGLKGFYQQHTILTIYFIVEINTTETNAVV